MAARRAAALALRRLASAAASASPRPALLLAPLRSPSAPATTRLIQLPTTAAAALYARRGYATRGRKARVVSEDEDDDDEDEFEAIGSDGEYNCDFDDEDMEDFDDDEEEEEE